MEKSNLHIDPKSGFCSATKTFHSLKPTVELPPQHLLLSADAYAFSLRSGLGCPDSAALINSTTGHRLLYSEFALRSKTLAAYLQTVIGLSKGDTAFVLSSNLIQVPILYFSLLSLGVIISPANPINTQSEISRLIELCKPVIAFSISTAAHKLPSLHHRTVIIDSFEFDSMMTGPIRELVPVEVSQSDLAAIMYSSGTTGRVKGVMLTHRNLIAMTASIHEGQSVRSSPDVLFDLRRMLTLVEKFKVTHMAVVPPVLVAMAKGDATDNNDLTSLESVSCGGAPLGKDLCQAFTAKFPNVAIRQGYGLTESSGAVSRLLDPEECRHWGSVGRLTGIFEAKIVDPDTGLALPPCKQGELWVRGPAVMKGYVGDRKATRETLVSDGWLRTGDLCYIDGEGFLYVVDRLKELIKYKGYQVAPAELEHLLQSHPEIVDAAVIPYPDEEAGEVPMAYVVRRPQSSLNEAQVMDFIAKQVAAYKKIRRVLFVSSIPKSPAGKILRKELRKLAVPGSLSKL
ncbi:unnamed protein product, partial [Vitis vinifera]